jgi:hypothetical protein
MARITTVRQRPIRMRVVHDLARLLRTQVAAFATAAVLVALLAGYVLILGLLRPPPPAPDSSPPVLASPSALVTGASTPSASPPSTAANEAIVVVDGPVTPEVANEPGYEEPETYYLRNAGDDVELPHLRKYVFRWPWDCACWNLEILLDPGADYAGTMATNDTLVVRYRGVTGSQTPAGGFQSSAGECVITFEEYSPTLVEGSVACADATGEYRLRSWEEDPQPGVWQLTATFSFDPRIVPSPL